MKREECPPLKNWYEAQSHKVDQRRVRLGQVKKAVGQGQWKALGPVWFLRQATTKLAPQRPPLNRSSQLSFSCSCCACQDERERERETPLLIIHTEASSSSPFFQKFARIVSTRTYHCMMARRNPFSVAWPQKLSAVHNVCIPKKKKKKKWNHAPHMQFLIKHTLFPNSESTQKNWF